jgi:hypothetical protein
LRIATAWCDFVLPLGGAGAASKTNGLAGNSVPSTTVVHFGIYRDHLKFLAALNSAVLRIGNPDSTHFSDNVRIAGNSTGTREFMNFCMEKAR